MASGQRYHKWNNSTKQDHNRRWRLLHRAQGLKHRKTGLGKYAGTGGASSPIANTINYTENTQLLLTIRGELIMVDIALNNYGTNTSVARRVIREKLLRIEGLIDQARAQLDREFINECDHLIRNRTFTLGLMINRGKDMPEIWEQYQELIRNLEKLEAKNERS